jgi:hypothetical protein
MAATREVTNVIPSHEAMALVAPKPFPVEVRQKRDGSWAVLYPDPGFLPCAPNCRFGQQGEPFRGHKHDTTPNMIETNYKPASFDEAKRIAEQEASSAGIKVIPYTSRGAKVEDEVRVIEREEEDD